MHRIVDPTSDGRDSVALVQIRIRPTVIEEGVHREQYAALVEALREHDVEAQIVRSDEYRSIDPEIAHAAHDVYIWLADHAAAGLIGYIVAECVNHLRKDRNGKPRRRRSGVIYGPDDKVLREFVIEEDD